MTNNTTPAHPEPIVLVSNGHRFHVPACAPGCTCHGTYREPALELTAAELIAEHTGRREYLTGEPGTT
jgi:hypothetical protein